MSAFCKAVLDDVVVSFPVIMSTPDMGENYIALYREANIASSGSNPHEARTNLSSLIEDIYKYLSKTPDDKLGRMIRVQKYSLQRLVDEAICKKELMDKKRALTLRGVDGLRLADDDVIIKPNGSRPFMKIICGTDTMFVPLDSAYSAAFHVAWWRKLADETMIIDSYGASMQVRLWQQVFNKATKSRA